MEAAFLCKVEGKLGGDAADVKEVRLLGRSLRWTPEGLTYEADPRHAEILWRDLERAGVSLERPLSSPGLKRTVEEEEQMTALSPDKTAVFRTGAARANYLSLDRPDTAYAAKGVLSPDE